MSLKEVFDAISRKTAEAGKQKAEITRKLEANKGEKARAEKAKAAALDAKDEQAYKEACRAIADAEAGIEFNTICLQEAQQKKLATDADDATIKSGLKQGMREIYVDAILKIEKLANEMKIVSESAIQKLLEINSMAASWDTAVMNNREYRSPFCQEKTVALNGFLNNASARLVQLEAMKKNDPFFTKGGK